MCIRLINPNYLLSLYRSENINLQLVHLSHLAATNPPLLKLFLKITLRIR